MSLYIGNNGSEKVLHIYNGSTGAESNVFSGTSFHSSLPYFSVVKKINFTNIGYDVFLGKRRQNFSASIQIPPASQYDKILIRMNTVDGKFIFFPLAETHLFPNTYNDHYRIFVGDVLSRLGWTFTSASTGFLYSYISQSSSVYFNLANVLDITVYFITNELTQSASDIKISSSIFKINGIDVFNKYYMYPLSSIADKINSYDEVIAIPVGGYGASKAMLNYVSTYDFSTFTSTYPEPGGGTQYAVNCDYILIQLINSYDYPITSVQLSSNPSSISVVKNNISITEFVASMYMRASITNSVNISVSSNVTTWTSSSLWNKAYIGTYSIPSGNANSFILISYTLDDATRDTSIFNIRGATCSKYFNGASVPIYVRGTNAYIEGVIDTINNTILVQLNFGQTTGGSTSYYGFSFVVTIIT